MKIFKTYFLAAFLFLVSSSTFSQQAAPVSTSTIKTILVDLAGEQYANTTLDDIFANYKGNIIYLDFWASWCHPCRQEMPYSLELQKKFQGKDVVFLYMSTDKNAQSWENMVKQLQLTGMNYRASNTILQQVYKQFNLQYIPRYVLIDKTGKVVDANAKRPSNPAVAGDIEKLLQ